MNQLLVVIGLFLVGAALSALFARSPGVSSLVGSTTAALGSALGLVVAGHCLVLGQYQHQTLGAWALPGAAFSVGVDPLSAFFLLPVFLLGALTSMFGHSYLAHLASPSRRGTSYIAFNVLLSSMTLVLVARHAVLFLIAWETMSLSAYFLITYEHEEPETRKAGWIYLVAAHVGVACLVSLFLLIGSNCGSLEFAAIAATPMHGVWLPTVAFLLAVIGFGAKAGLLPIHIWLPQAHAAAPSHVSALMSGALIKLGIYGILRTVLLLGGPRNYWGAGLLVLGVCTALFGISLAAYQRDLKRVLAYSSIENIGIIALGVGLGFWGQSTGHPRIAILGTVGALLHVLNHSAMKGLMFMLSGSVLRGCHTKDLEHLGGLGKRMPVTFGLFALGAVAISGLPPLSAFVSEWLLYSGLMKGALTGEGAGAVACILAVAMLSLVGAIAALCFARLIGAAMLGEPRSTLAANAKESPLGLLVPMLVLGALVVVQALIPAKIVQWIAPVADQLLGAVAANGTPELGLRALGRLNLGLLLLVLATVGLGGGIWRRRIKSRNVPTWDCGYVAPTSRMQYTARGMSELLTEILVPSRFAPRAIVRLPRGILPQISELKTDQRDPLTRDAYEPFIRTWADRFAKLRVMQQGHLHIYLLYILLALLLAIGFSVIRSGFGAS